MRDGKTRVGAGGRASLSRLRRRLLWGTAALAAVLFVLWWRWQVDLHLLFEMVAFSVGFVFIAAMAGLGAGALLAYARRPRRGSAKLGAPVGSKPGAQGKGLSKGERFGPC